MGETVTDDTVGDTLDTLDNLGTMGILGTMGDPFHGVTVDLGALSKYLKSISFPSPSDSSLEDFKLTTFRVPPFKGSSAESVATFTFMISSSASAEKGVLTT